MGNFSKFGKSAADVRKTSKRLMKKKNTSLNS